MADPSPSEPEATREDRPVGPAPPRHPGALPPSSRGAGPAGAEGPAFLPPSEPAPPRLLRRSPDRGIVAGIAEGLGRYLGLDPVLVRIAFVLLALAGGAGILLYLVLGLVMPKEAPGDRVEGMPPGTLASLRRIAGWLLLGGGAVLLVGRFVPGVDQAIWPLALLALGAAVLVQAGRR